MNTELLNKVKELLINFANDNGISLQAEFGTREKFASFVISFTILSLKNSCGMETQEAYDTVMGDGAYQTLAEDVWNRVNA